MDSWAKSGAGFRLVPNLVLLGQVFEGVPLYQHFADLAGNGAKLTLPVPCFNVINGGSHAGDDRGAGFPQGTGAKRGNRAASAGFRVFQVIFLYSLWIHIPYQKVIGPSKPT